MTCTAPPWTSTGARRADGAIVSGPAVRSIGRRRYGVVVGADGRIGIDPAARRAQCDVLRRRFSGMDWETMRLLDLHDLLDCAHDRYFDEGRCGRCRRWLGSVVASAHGSSVLGWR